MIEFTRSDKELRVSIKNGPLNYTYKLSWACQDDCYAELLKNHFEKVMKDKIAEIRQESYNLGWKEARAKVKKRDWFSGWW